MTTLVYGEDERKKYRASLNISIYQPDRKHYFNAMRLIDAIMEANRRKKGVISHNPRSGKYRVTMPNACSPITFRIRKMA